MVNSLLKSNDTIFYKSFFQLWGTLLSFIEDSRKWNPRRVVFSTCKKGFLSRLEYFASATMFFDEVQGTRPFYSIYKISRRNPQCLQKVGKAYISDSSRPTVDPLVCKTDLHD